MSRSWQESRRHGGSEHQTDLYAGPEEYMEVGGRGFLVNTLLGKEEVGIDDAIDLLRQATIKLYGGIKPRTKKFETSDGFVKIDFMDPETVVVLPHPEGELIEEPAEEPQADDAGQEKQNGSSKDEQKGEAAEGEAKDEKKAEGEAEGEKMDEGSSEKDKDKKKNGDGESKGEEKKAEPKHDVQWMQSSYKFKTYRTEIRNMMFVKSDVPDPVLVADAAMEIVIGRKSVTGDAVRQLLPVLGVCPYDCYQLEVMTRCTLSPMFDESLDPKGFSVFLMDKLSDPGSDLLIETIRNTIWSINPLSWQASPLIEPDVVIRLEIIGKKLVLSCLSHFMRYRHYNPKLLLEVGVGELEDDDGSWVPADVRKMQEMIRADRERKRELERKRDEEYRKEREKRRAEAEARRQERQKEREREEKERRLQREKDRERRRMEEKKDDKGHEKKEDKGSEKDKKDEEKKKQESATDKEKTEESPAVEQKADEKVEEQKEEKKGRARKAANVESPPSKKAKVEEVVAPPEEEEGVEMEEALEMEESEEGAEEETKDKKAAAAKKGAAKPSKRVGRRKGKK